MRWARRPLDSVGDIELALRRLPAELATRGAAWSLIGGFAVGARTEPRFTRDVDVAVAVADDAAAEGLVSSLRAEGYLVITAIEQDAVGRLAAVRLARAGTGAEVIIDLLFASSGIEADIVAAAEPLEVLDGLVVPVARTGHLLALKLLARNDDTRPQDGGDIIALRDVADESELALARQAVELITERGYDRGRDLRAALDALLS